MKLKISGALKAIREFLLYVGLEYRVEDLEIIDDFAYYSVAFCDLKKGKKKE